MLTRFDWWQGPSPLFSGGIEGCILMHITRSRRWCDRCLVPNAVWEAEGHQFEAACSRRMLAYTI